MVFHLNKGIKSIMDNWTKLELPFKNNGVYITECGKVRCSKRGVRKIYDNGAGYKNVRLKNLDKGGNTILYVHRLVAQAFLETTCPTKTQVNHKDGDKSNNHVDNLEWVSPSENIRHMHKERLSVSRKGNVNYQKTDDKTVAYAYSKVVMGISGVGETAREYGMPRTTLSSIVNKRSRKDVTDAIDELMRFN